MQANLKALFGLRWNPFLPDVPIDAIFKAPQIENFLWRVEQLVMDGGFAMITGEPGTGKSVTLRLTAARLSKIPKLAVIQITRPQSGLLDFYRELCQVFDIEVGTTNRFYGYKKLREKWLAHIDSTLFKPIIVIDEAQEMQAQVLSELRLLTSTEFDSKIIAGIILCGDNRLPEMFRSQELLPIGSRIKVRLRMESRMTKDNMQMLLDSMLEQAGVPELMTPGVKDLLIENSLGNVRQLMIFSNELLAEASMLEVNQIDENVFYKCYQPEQSKPTKKLTKKT